jgi:hypothetical protein
MSSALTCPDCTAPFAVDQRYCTECGRRVRPLPHGVATTLAAMSGARRIGADRLSSTAAAPGGAASPTGGSPLMLFGQPLEFPSPRAMAVAVMALLAFGVIVGTSSFSLASSPLLVTVNRSVGAAATTTASASAPLALSSPGPSAGSAPAASGGGATSSAPTASGNSSGTNLPNGSSSSTGTTTTAATSNGLPPIKHVWIIQLGDQGYANTFDSTSSDTYLNKTLASQGEVVPHVYASATSDLANEIGLISGQGPTVQTESDCPTYTAVTPGTVGGDGQVAGDGCVYPDSTASFESELSAAGMSWKAYVQGQGILPATSCIHPELAAADTHFTLTSPAGYATWRNPLVYLTDVTQGGCTYQDTGLAKLKSDLSNSATTPNVSFIYANPCDDGSDAPCLPGAAAGTAQSDAFLQSVVPEIMKSAAYQADGMILVTFAQAPQTGTGADQSSCCDQPAQFPNLPSADYEPSPTTTITGTTTTGTGTDSTGTATDSTGTDSTGTGTDSTGTGTDSTGTDTTVTSVTSTVPVPFNTATISGPIITIPGVSAPIGTTTAPQGLITGTETSATITAGTTTPTGIAGIGTTATTTSTTACPTTTTGTTTGTGTTTTATSTGTGTTGTSPTGTSTTVTTGTETTTTGTGSAPGCSTSSMASPTGGGGQVGMLVLSKYVTPNSPDGVDYFNTFSITASLEQLFNLKLTGYASTTGLPVFSSFLYSAYNSG